MIKNFSNFISEKIDIDTNIFWFEKSNKYLIINNLLNCLILNKIDSNKYPLNQFSSDINDLKPENLKTIFNDIESLLKECDIESRNKTYDELSINDEKFLHFSKFKFNERVVKIEYSNKELRNLIDPKFAHIKCDDNEQIVFKVQQKNKRIQLFKQDKFIGNWCVSEMHEFQGKMSMELTSFFHEIQESDWTAVFHGSTLSMKNNCLMLTGESGNGKSSLSTILMSNNFSLIADDFSPMSHEGLHYNFPSAISIKEGFYSTAKKLFKSSDKLKEYYINDIKGNVKYLPANNNELILSNRCNKVINVKFGPDLKNEIKIVNKGKALEKILPDTWISKDLNHAKSFIDWIKSSSFYDLTYNDNYKMLKMIKDIF